MILAPSFMGLRHRQHFETSMLYPPQFGQTATVIEVIMLLISKIDIEYWGVITKKFIV